MATSYYYPPPNIRADSDTPFSLDKVIDGEDPTSPAVKGPLFVRRPITLYLGYLAPIALVFILALVFMLHLSVHGAVSASRWMTNKSLEKPRETAQVVTIIASILTATVTWSLSNAATLLAQKRFFKQFRPIMEIEVLSALKNIGVVWGWQYSKRAMLLTWLIFAACALLTSGFVSLISPLAIAKASDIAGTSELNFAASSPSCLNWYNTVKNVLVPSAPGGISICDSYLFKDFSYSSCLSVTQLPQAFGAATATILGYFASFQPARKQSNFVSSFTNFNNSRILGGTAGTLPTGPAGVQVFDFPKLNRTSDNFNYTLNLQGLWLDTSCVYDTDSNFTFSFNQTAENVNQYSVGCPGIIPQTWNIPKGLTFNGITIAYPCFTDDKITVYWRSMSNNGTTNRDAVDFAKCSLIPKVGNVQAGYFTNLAAFKMDNRTAPANSSPMTNPLSRDIITLLIQELVFVVYYSQSEVGNAWVDLLRSIGQSYGGLSAKQFDHPNETVLRLIGQAIQGIFEFQATTMRIMLTAKAESDMPAPPECLQPVVGRFVEGLIGWNLQSSTILGLIPLFIVMLTAFTMIILATRIKGKLTVFDPTNPSSLIAATSMGDVKLAPGQGESAITGHLKNMGQTKISFGDHGGKWGFKSGS